MDHSSLLYQIGELEESRKSHKLNSLRYAWSKTTKIVPSVSFETFVSSIPTFILNTQFGRKPEDIYYTALLAAGGFFQREIDPVFACVLNRLVIELNFQTRYIGTGKRPEAFVLDGNPIYLPFAAANGNTVACIQVAVPDTGLPAWAIDLEHLDYQLENVIHTSLEQVPIVLEMNIRDRIGGIAVSLPLNSEPSLDFAARYQHLSPKISEDTFQTISAPLSMGLELMEAITLRHPEARIDSKVYKINLQDDELKIILIVTGVKGIIQVSVNQKVSLTSTFVSMNDVDPKSNANVLRIPYFKNNEGGDFETVDLKAPIAVRSSSPLPYECRDRITSFNSGGIVRFPHQAYAFKNGKMAAIEGIGYSSHVYFNGDGNVIKELSGDNGVELSPLYRDSTVDNKGKRTGHISLDRRIKIDGPAMPLTFTPSLHTFHSHFLLQCFPRVLIFRQLIPHGKIIVPAGLRKKQIEMLKMVGIDESQLVFLPVNVLVEADEMLIPHPWPLVFSPYTLQIYEELVAKIPNAPPVTKRALISREQRTTWRNMLTYELVKDTLVDRYGFEVIRPETLSLAEEVNLYRNVEFMIGAEGAGLYSAVYSKPGSTYISIGDEDYIMPVLASAASVRGFDLAYAFGDSMRSDFDVERRKPYGHSDFVVDPETVTQLLEDILASRPN